MRIRLEEIEDIMDGIYSEASYYECDGDWAVNDFIKQLSAALKEHEERNKLRSQI